MPVLTLTNEVIEALICPPEKKHLEVFDDVLKGFYVDVLPSGRITYRIRYWHNAKKGLQSIGNARSMRVQDARNLALAAIQKIKQENAANKPSSGLSGVTLNDFLTQQYLPYVQSYKRSWKSDVSMINTHIAPALGQLVMCKVSAFEITNFIESMKHKNLAPGTINRALVLLRYTYKLAQRWQELTKTPLIEGYGLTECSPTVTVNPFDLREYSGSIGLPLPSTEVSIRDTDGRELPIGQAGELCVRGPQVMRGYWQRPEETAAVMTADGFLRTGDVAVMDGQGFLKIVDRLKDMILVSGFNVYPNEIEDVVMSHPGVLEVAAVGHSSEATGEAVKLFVVKRSPALTEHMLVNHCRESLTAYKVPRQIEFLNELPKSNVGKILRRELRDRA